MKKRPRSSAILGLITFFLLISLPIASQSAIMTFDSAPECVLCGWFGQQTDYIENGIKISLIFNHYDSSFGKVNIDTFGGGFGAIKFEMADGSPFELNSLYIRTTSSPYYVPEYLPPFDFILEYKIYFPIGISLIIDPGVDMLLLLGIKNISYFTCLVR